MSERKITMNARFRILPEAWRRAKAIAGGKNMTLRDYLGQVLENEVLKKDLEEVVQS